MGWPPELNTCVHDKYNYEHCEACEKEAKRVTTATIRKRNKKKKVQKGTSTAKKKENKKQRTPREYTRNEVQKKFLQHCWAMVEYWKNVDDSKDNALEGLMLSFLVMLDGGAAEMPAFTLIPTPHELDTYYAAVRGENYYRPFRIERSPLDVHGGSSLQELMYSWAPHKLKAKTK